MKSASFRFGPFTLDAESRLLARDGAALDVSSRYFDALVLLVRNAGDLVPKAQFMDEVWRGVPVTDEALTQCVRSLRRILQDDAARPSFIETVPKHGYRFIATVDVDTAVSVNDPPAGYSGKWDWRTFRRLGGAGIIGGGIAGLLGGVFYGFTSGAQGMGGASIVLVLTALTVMIALMGAVGVSFGMATIGLMKPDRGLSTILGGAAGGFLVGGIVKLLGLDAFNLMLGKSPAHITGALEGAILGGAVGLSLYLASHGSFGQSLSRRVLSAAVVGLSAGVAILAAGGQLLGGSLHALAQLFPQSRLRLDQIGALLGEDGFGRMSQIATGGLEGMLFVVCMTVAIMLAEGQLTE
jgi:DNA-binding winged helix-turn-helix (wHTH) protein